MEHFVFNSSKLLKLSYKLLVAPVPRFSGQTRRHGITKPTTSSSPRHKREEKTSWMNVKTIIASPNLLVFIA